MTQPTRTRVLPTTLLLATVLTGLFAATPILPVVSAQAEARAAACDFSCRLHKSRERWRWERALKKSNPPKPDKPGQKQK